MKKTLRVADEKEARVLCGEMDRNLRMIERLTGVRIGVRGETVYLEGEEGPVEEVGRILEDVRAAASRGRAVTREEMENLFRQMAGGRKVDLPGLFSQSVLVAPRKTIVPKGPNQKLYLEHIQAFDIVFGIGPAGTGKTYLAMAAAIHALMEKKVSRIILARPAVEAGERLGFLPGDIQEKVNPYLRPLYDALFDMMSSEKGLKLIERSVIEIAPLAFMRGRTLNDSFVILDEAQNSTSEQMKMFLTRLGFNSKAVITGDITQIDLPGGKVSGLVEVIRLLEGIEGIRFVRFDERDVVRHPLVQEIIRAYERQGI